MVASSEAAGSNFLLDHTGLGGLVAFLQGRGYEVIGPQVRDASIVYECIEKAEDLPAGWSDEQAPGRYRLSHNGSKSLFGFAVGPHSWKQFLHPAQSRLTRIERDGAALRIFDGANDAILPPRLAFLGVRACELAAIAVQDRVLMGDEYKDPGYAARRKNVFIVAVQCTRSVSTCFCTSMNTGPKVHEGYDLVLTELPADDGTFFVASAGTEAGAEALAELRPAKATAEMVRRAEAAVETAAAGITRRLDTEGIRDIIYKGFEHPRWDDVAARCLNCGNCTLACPTCFCSTVEDTSNVGGTCAERWRRWDSCFVQSFSYIHGGSVRMSSRSRYRQWLTHKLAAWIDQFGTSGCVGCGRCITWCPVGIDIAEEASAIRGGTSAAGEQTDAGPDS
jgi:ferredoxin